jgi:hypothetical protein
VFIATLFLKIESGRHVRELNHIDIETAGLTLRQDLAVERTRLSAHIACFDLRKIFVEALHDTGSTRLVLVAVEDQLAFLLRLRNIGVSFKVQNFGG